MKWRRIAVRVGWALIIGAALVAFAVMLAVALAPGL
jgi:hypothetical protein